MRRVLKRSFPEDEAYCRDGAVESRGLLFYCMTRRDLHVVTMCRVEIRYRYESVFAVVRYPLEMRRGLRFADWDLGVHFVVVDCIVPQ